MKLSKEVWHGFTRPAGTEVKPDSRVDGSDTKDEHGCGNSWVRDNDGLINVWDCEVTR